MFDLEIDLFLLRRQNIYVFFMKHNTYFLSTCFHKKIKKKKKRKWFYSRFTVLLKTLFIAQGKNDKNRLHTSGKIKERQYNFYDCSYTGFFFDEKQHITCSLYWKTNYSSVYINSYSDEDCVSLLQSYVITMCLR